MRIGPHGLVYSEYYGHNYPRVLELLILLYSSGSIFYYRKFNFNNTDKMFLAFSAIFTISCYYHGRGWDIWRSCIILPYLLFFSLKNENPIRQIKFLIPVGIISSLIIILQRYLENYVKLDVLLTQDHSVRIGGLGQGLAYQATYLGFILVLILFFTEKLNYRQYFGALIVIIAIISTGTRAILFFVFLLVPYYLYIKIRVRPLITISYLIILLLSYYFLVDYFKMDLVIKESTARINKLSILSSAVIRLDLWITGIRVSLNNIIIGIGDFKTESVRSGLGLPIAHVQNGFIATLHYSGIFGFILYYKFIMNIITNSSKVMIGYIIMILYSIVNMTEIVWSSVQVQVVFFLLLSWISFHKSNVKTKQGVVSL